VGAGSVERQTLFRVTRDAAFSVASAADDLLEALELGLRRRRLGDEPPPQGRVSPVVARVEDARPLPRQAHAVGCLLTDRPGMHIGGSAKGGSRKRRLIMANLVRRNQGSVPQQGGEWDPFRMMRELLSMDPFSQMMPSLAQRDIDVFAPRFDVKETKDAYIFKADLPGVREEDLDITLTGSRLTISGKREAESRDESDRWYAYERSYGSFSRSFTLPEGIDGEHVDADLKNGELTVRVSKAPEHQPRKISLKGLGEKLKGALGSKEKHEA
jgi:HSP20 family protein